MRSRFRTKLFVGSVLTAASSLLAVGLLLSWQVERRQSANLERRLVTEARLIARALEAEPSTRDTLDKEAHEFGKLVESRITLIADDGRVLGDSTQTPAGRAALDNHNTRPEVLQAREAGLGTIRRYSETVLTDMLYVAVPTTHPAVKFVRVAMPLTEVDAQVSTIRQMTLVALGIGVPLALLVAWLASAPIARQVQEIARAAERYARGDLPTPREIYPPDELGTVARALDVTAHELGTKVDDLSRDRARIDAILSDMVEGVLVVDGRGRVQQMNHAATALLDIDQRMLGQHFVTAIRHPEIAAQLTAATKGAVGDPLERPLPRDPSRTVVSRASPVPVARGGGAVLVLHDISDIRRVDRMRQDFVANVSHELRTPLTAVRGYAEALADATVDAESARGFAEIIGRNTTRMERLVADLLRLARLDARQEPIALAPCGLLSVLNDVVEDQAEGVERKRQRIQIDVAPDARTVSADTGKLHDILRNLLENAVNYSPEGAEIRLSADVKDDTVVITVADTGPGIPPADLSRVFERFYRVDKSRARPGGTGLGLAIVKHLVELHGGSVSVANAPSGGAVFTVQLPNPGL